MTKLFLSMRSQVNASEEVALIYQWCGCFFDSKTYFPSLTFYHLVFSLMVYEAMVDLKWQYIKFLVWWFVRHRCSVLNFFCRNKRELPGQKRPVLFVVFIKERLLLVVVQNLWTSLTLFFFLEGGNNYFINVLKLENMFLTIQLLMSFNCSVKLSCSIPNLLLDKSWMCGKAGGDPFG